MEVRNNPSLMQGAAPRCGCHRSGSGPEQLNAVFFTYMHNDHTDGFEDLVQSRWAFHGTGPKIDAICSSDVVSPQGVTLSCGKFVTHIADAFIQSGEIAQSHSEVLKNARPAVRRIWSIRLRSSQRTSLCRGSPLLERVHNAMTWVFGRPAAARWARYGVAARIALRHDGRMLSWWSVQV